MASVTERLVELDAVHVVFAGSFDVVHTVAQAV